MARRFGDGIAVGRLALQVSNLANTANFTIPNNNISNPARACSLLRPCRHSPERQGARQVDANPADLVEIRAAPTMRGLFDYLPADDCGALERPLCRYVTLTWSRPGPRGLSRVGRGRARGARSREANVIRAANDLSSDAHQ